MATLHDRTVRESLGRRVQALAADAKAQWGKMSVDQMLWHVNQAMAQAVGEVTAAPVRAPLPKPVIKFMVLTFPMPRNAPTQPTLLATMHYDVEAERERCLRLIDAIASRQVDGPWPVSPGLGKMSGDEWGRLHAKHLDHHLKQFGA